MVERGSGIAVWRQIGESLADDIRNKLYMAGEQLPSEPELAAKFSVNRHTIRRAMGELEQSGLVRIEQGRGTFVQEHAIDYAIGKRTRFSENLRSQGMLGHLEALGSQTLRAADIAKHLGLARNAPLLRVQMVGKAENRPISASEHYFDEKRCGRYRRSTPTTTSATTRANGRASPPRCRRRRWRASWASPRRARSCRSRP